MRVDRFTRGTIFAIGLVVATTTAGFAQGEQREATFEPPPRTATASAEDAAQILAATLPGIWPGWEWTATTPRSARSATVTNAVRRSVMPESSEPWIDGAAAFANRFASEIEPRVKSRFGFVDAEIPAPESWAVEARLRFAADEARALHACVIAQNGEEATGAASDFLRSRFRRVAASHDRDIAAWRARELTHGLAAYATYRSLLVADAPRESRSVAVALRRGMLAMLNEAASTPELLTPELSGFALAMSLDRTGLPWHGMATEELVALDSLLAGPPKNFGNR